MKLAFVTSAFTILNLLLIGILFYLIFRFLSSGIKYFTTRTQPQSQQQLIRKTLSENLKEARLKNNMTQEFVAQQLGVSRQAVSKWETAASEPSTSNLIALARLYNISLLDLLPKN